MKIKLNDHARITVNQSLQDVIKGYRQDDFSRLSAYRGDLVGVHTGSQSPTVARHNSVFGSPESTFFRTLKPYR